MNDNENLREQITNNLIANECALDHVTGGVAAKEIPIPGTDRVMYIGTPADVLGLLNFPAAEKPAGYLTDGQIKQVAREAVAAGKLSWLGFDKDEDGRYTVPTLSTCHYQFARAIERAAIAAHLASQSQAAQPTEIAGIVGPLESTMEEMQAQQGKEGGND